MSEKLVAMTFEEASKWIASQENRIRELEAAKIKLQAALAFWMPDENQVTAEYQDTWDKHIELLPPAADRIGAALNLGLEAETKAEFPEEPLCSFCGRNEPAHIKLNHIFMLGGTASNRGTKP